MTGPPRKSPLFPSPPLSRSVFAQLAGQADAIQTRHVLVGQHQVDLFELCLLERIHAVNRLHNAKSRPCEGERHRSEEHTSELQSPCNLVCRLLLEKKKSNYD